MNPQEQLQKARQELLEFQQIVQQDERIDQASYQERLKQMRYMQQNHPDFSNLNLTRGYDGVGGDASVAMAMGQLNIEARIRRLEELAATQVLTTTVPARNIVAPPPEAPPEPEVQQAPQVQRVSKWQRVKNWFKRNLTRQRHPAGGPPPAPEAPTAAPVQEIQRDCKTVIPAIQATQVNSHVGDVQRFQKANPDDVGIVTPEELAAMQKNGARGSDGQFLARRNVPVVAPILEQTKELFDNLKTGGFDFDTAISGMRELEIGVGYVNVNEATVAMVTKAMGMWNEYLENEHVQEYITMLYESVGQVLKDNVKTERGNDAIPNDADFDNHIMEILPTRGLECFRGQVMLSDISASNRKFATECSKLMSKMSHVEKFLSRNNDPSAAELLQPMIAQYHILKDKISQIGAPRRAIRLNAINNPPAAD